MRGASIADAVAESISHCSTCGRLLGDNNPKALGQVLERSLHQRRAHFYHQPVQNAVDLGARASTR